MLTGVRGVGKTTTARILARALNYELPDGIVKGPSIDMPKMGLHCQAIMEGRHVDVIEMDAASHTGIDDIREIIDACAMRRFGALQGLHHRRSAHALDGRPSTAC
jgi:DNA polymerase-3 subunit gamma/tau